MRSLSREKSRSVITLLAILALPVLSCLVCRPLVNSIWYEMSCDGLGIVGDGFLIEALGIEYHAPRRSFPIEDLLLDESVFPQGWEVGGEPYNPEDRMPAEQIALSFFADTSECPSSLITGHDVYRYYGGASCADMGYRSKAPTWFSPWEGYDPWRTPAELSYQSPAANRFRLSCCTRQGSSVQICQATAQYQEYLVRFDTSIDPERPDCMSFADLGRILVAIDERMALYLGEDSE